MGEDIACQFLEQKGFHILDRNYRKPWGEIDIIAEKSNQVRFVEVKAVSREARRDISREMDYRPEEMVHVRKLKKLARTVRDNLKSYRLASLYKPDDYCNNNSHWRNS